MMQDITPEQEMEIRGKTFNAMRAVDKAMSASAKAK
jgi:hypothetical protein